MRMIFFSLAALALAGPLSAQTPAAPPAATPAERRVRLKENQSQLLERGSFEVPQVQARTPKSDGGNPLLFSQEEWSRFDDKPDAEGGRILLGLTNEVAHSGRQSIFVQFDKVVAAQALAEISSQLIPIKPGKEYRIGIWGRVDKKQPLTIEQRIPLLRLTVDYFQADRETQTGEGIYRIQPMPGSLNRRPYFVTNRWSEYFAQLTSPQDAAFVKITWTWVTTPDKGTTSGVIYFDDATLIGEAVPPEAPEEPAEPAAPAEPAP